MSAIMSEDGSALCVLSGIWSLFSGTFLSFFSGFPYEKVRERTLYLQVLDYDRFSRNDPIGEVSIPLNKVELGQIKTFWKELKPCSDGSVRTEQIITRRLALALNKVISLNASRGSLPPKRAPITGP